MKSHAVVIFDFNPLLLSGRLPLPPANSGVLPMSHVVLVESPVHTSILILKVNQNYNVMFSVCSLVPRPPQAFKSLGRPGYEATVFAPLRQCKSRVSESEECIVHDSCKIHSSLSDTLDLHCLSGANTEVVYTSMHM